MTSYRCLRSVQRNLPALQHCVKKGIINLNKAKIQRTGPTSLSELEHTGGSTGTQTTINLTTYLDDTSPRCQEFVSHLNFALHALQPLAWALKLLEAPATTMADVFIHWLTVAHQYLQIFQSPDSPLVQQFPEECRQIIIRFNIQFQKGILNHENCLYALAFFLHPQYHAHSILHYNNQPVMDQIARRLFQAFTAMSQRSDDVTDDVTEPERTPGPSLASCKRFFTQLAQYKHHEPPFNVPYRAAALETPRKWWERLLHIKGVAVKELAEVAIMVFSVKPSSLPEERCGSIIDWLMPGRRNRLKPATLIQMIKLRNFYLYTHNGRRQLMIFTISHADVARDVLPNALHFNGATAHRPEPPGHQPSDAVESHHDPVERMLPPTRMRTTDEADCVIADAAEVAELLHPVIAGLAAQMSRNTDQSAVRNVD
jgi:hypothetical protein